MSSDFDIIIQGGHLIDPKNDIDGPADICHQGRASSLQVADPNQGQFGKGRRRVRPLCHSRLDRYPRHTSTEGMAAGSFPTSTPCPTV